ncbi:MAG: Fe(3+) ABC transporter substrate-binding protein [gamma proteobacterium symbiont of Ctena orbiculata]|uniref:Fe(3+) ABC transporter substrate-binding protein n=1 Tax=Candidatus Thiodiazotropha taylori TaxID=2792791 RepID=A0A944QS28_9GAMM|nr:Fe(3+) ABC transporter substrate-binding protein [Candidatus Thiodiazotropha taylori]PUB82455.1 MAG: Fe(3+) ABC transporter substrate-binding protein [gamma proteobacterium symbiont of Ctena orbiculata]MBT2988413.1 Fe(3+) ABC transporter substrate-binding protein [Candidatus Thiodiazotropha taylori]MBT2997320.1 Fe(3+) ABC transporter substrate-binding protein [Candidatus Thiodiazotropha taylori]MBT3000970.1 Fe(3+) ABC transporter substrate-binding protein [Candidatus Thiodiazotropha taylori]
MLGLLLTFIAPSLTLAEEVVNLYSARKEKLIKPLLDRFSEQTGINVNLVTGKADALLQRLQSEGRNTPADMLITTDAGRLHRAKAAGVTQAVDSPVLKQLVPESFRDPQGHWYGLSVRARPILYVKGKVDPARLSTYEALIDPEWDNRICIRSSGNIYNQSLVASMIAANGAEATETWAKAFVNQFARPPKGGDRDQIKAAAAGLCDIAVANTYYLAGMLTSKDQAQRDAAGKLAVFWPNQQGRGAHVNVSGATVTKAASNRENAIKLLEFLLNPASQAWYAETNGEFPVRADVEPGELLNGWGEFKMDKLNLQQLGLLNPDAVRLMDRAGWK